eukprot:2277983-Pyramimonas_sp.AAC.1
MGGQSRGDGHVHTRETTVQLAPMARQPSLATRHACAVGRALVGKQHSPSPPAAIQLADWRSW